MEQAANVTDPISDGSERNITSPITDFSDWVALAERLAQSEVRRRLDLNHMAGRPVYFGGTGADKAKVFVFRPDGTVVQVCVLEDGAIEEIGEGGV